MRWKISFSSRSSAKRTTATETPTQKQPTTTTTQPPKEFLCPISGSLMSDPVVVSSGQTFERVSVQVCRDLGFTPSLEDDHHSVPDFTTVIPNLAIRSTILNWCDASGSPRPAAPDYSSVEALVREKIRESSVSSGSSHLRFSERELLKGVAENPPVLFSHAATELTHRVNRHFYSSSSSDESVVIGPSTAAASPFTPLPLATRPACYSSTPPSSNSSSEIIESDGRNTTSSSCPEEDEILAKLKSTEVHEQEEGAILLRKITRTREETRLSLCSPRLLSHLKSLVNSRYSVVQTNTIASLVNLSLEKSNKVKIVRSGFVPLLIDVLKSGSSEPQEHAAGALFSLALEDDNKMAIGVLGALQPLMHALRSESERTRHDSSLALYHLSLIQSNRVKLVKLGAVPTLLSMLKVGDSSASRLLLVLCNLAASNEGRSAMLDANAVGILVGMLRQGGGGGEEVDSEATRENCVAALFALSHGSMRFKGLAKEARAVEVLREIEETGSQRAREKAKRILQMMRGGREWEADEESDSSGGLETAGLGGRTRYRVGVPGGIIKVINRNNGERKWRRSLLLTIITHCDNRKTRKRKQQQQQTKPQQKTRAKLAKINVDAAREEPYPAHLRPTPEECRAVRDSLLALHGFPPEFAKYRKKRPNLPQLEDPSLHANGDDEAQLGGTGAEEEEEESVLDGLVKTVLSQNTTESNSLRAFANLKSAFPSWENVLAAESKCVEEAIRCGGLAPKKASCIKNMLGCLLEKKGKLCLEYLRDLSVDEIKAELSHFKGIGPKTVFEIAKAIGWVPDAADRDKTYLHLNHRIPNELKFDLNCLLYTHGKLCRKCIKKGENRQRKTPPDNSCPLFNYSHSSMLNRTDKLDL
ncbi:U-box domain-containing protein 38 [Turnera subulata]|uniref:RING-type E3 ubiquitin transferase n=1 Tax=Turnera subulata TaxID=218843 RepID=A0A9Q0G2R5_9ROSI|nr:U-box domain-containing protein 38 [Turnera subulata]